MENIDFKNISKEELVSLLTKQGEQIATQNDKITEQNAKISDQNTKITELTTQVSILNEYIALAKQRQFSAKSEKLSANQLSFFDEAAMPKNPEAILKAEEEIQVASFTRKKSPGRKALPSELLREFIVYDLPEEEKICLCGCQLTHICDEKSEQLEGKSSCHSTCQKKICVQKL